MAKRLNKLRKSPHNPNKVFNLNLTKEQVDHLILLCETTNPEKLANDEEDEWTRRNIRVVHSEILELLRRTDIDNGD